MLTSISINYFSSHPALFGFKASSTPDNITLTPGSKNIGQIFSDIQTGNCAGAHAALGTEQLSSYVRTALVDTIATIQGSDGGIIADLEVHELLTKIHDIMDGTLI